jgi:hypothetical protein
MDGDGFLDLASIDSADIFLSDQPSVVTVRRGSGNRDTPFGETTGYPISTGATSMLLADLDSDGRPDRVASAGPSRTGADRAAAASSRKRPSIRETRISSGPSSCRPRIGMATASSTACTGPRTCISVLVGVTELSTRR